MGLEGILNERVVEGMGEMVVLIMVDSEEVELGSVDFWSEGDIVSVFLFFEVIAFLNFF